MCTQSRVRFCGAAWQAAADCQSAGPRGYPPRWHRTAAVANRRAGCQPAPHHGSVSTYMSRTHRQTQTNTVKHAMARRASVPVNAFLSEFNAPYDDGALAAVGGIGGEGAIEFEFHQHFGAGWDHLGAFEIDH